MTEYEKNFAKLAEQEAKIFALYAQGKEDSEIGQALHLSVHTVRNTLERVFVKLELDSLGRRERLRAVVLNYLPLLEKEVVQATPAEPKAVKASALFDPSYKGHEAKPDTTKSQTESRSVRLRVPLWFLIGIGIAGVGFLLWNFAGPAFAQTPDTPTTRPSATVRVTTTSAPTRTSLPTATLRPSATASFTPSATSTQGPFATATQEAIVALAQPTANLGPVYELGEWHTEGDLWFRLANYWVDWEGIYLTVEMWNKTSKPVYFQWSTNRSMFLTDNMGNRYPVEVRFDGRQDNETVEANTRKPIGADPYDDWTNWYEPDNLFLPGVTDLYLTLDYFSEVERATWHFVVSN